MRDNYGRTPKDLIWDQEREQFFENVRERELLQSKIIISGTVGFVTALLEAVIAMWLVQEGSIGISNISFLILMVMTIDLLRNKEINVKFSLGGIKTYPMCDFASLQRSKQENF